MYLECCLKFVSGWLYITKTHFVQVLLVPILLVISIPKINAIAAPNADIQVEGIVYHIQNKEDVQQSPSFSSSPLTSVNEDELYQYDIVASDPDVGDVMSITSDPLPAWLVLIDNGDGTATLSGTPTNDEVGTYSIKLIVEDQVGESGEQLFDLEVMNTNDAPSITSDPVLSGTLKDGYEYEITFDDIDIGDVLVLSIDSPLPPGFQLIRISGQNISVLRGDFQQMEIGVYEIILTLTDLAGASVQQIFAIEITEGNNSPTFISEPVIVAIAGGFYQYNIVVNDPDEGDVITITSGSLPPWLSFVDNGDGTATLSGTPSVGDVGLVSISLTANDNAEPNPGNSGQIFTLEIIESEHAPEFTSEPLETINEDEYYQYNISASDLDMGDVLTISSEILPSWLSLTDLGGGEALLYGTPQNQDVGSVSITLVATDLAGMQDLQTFTIEVINTNDAPIIVSSPVLSVLAGELYTYNIITSDPDIEDETVISASGIPPWLTLSDNGDGTAVLTGTPELGDVGMFNISITVQDLSGDTGGQFFMIEVVEINYPPEFTSAPVLTVELGSNYLYNVVANDPNSGDLLQFVFISAPDFLALVDNGDGTAAISGSPVLSDVGIHQVELRVEDGEGAFDVQIFEVEVIDPDQVINEPPEIVGFTIGLLEDQMVEFSINDFEIHFNDPNDDDIENLYIVKLPEHGILSVNGSQVVAPISISRADVNALIYVPEVNYNGADRFDWNADDGELSSEISAAANINISPVNDPPEDLKLSSTSINEGRPEGSVVGTLSVTDIDESDNHTYVFSAQNTDDADAFSIEDNRLLTAIVLDYNTKDTYEIFINATDGNGGTIDGSFTISVLPVEEVFLQNGITPNGDGLNDTWKIKSVENCDDCLVEIFNRWGQKMFSSVGYEKEWDGTYNNEDLPAGTYYYVIDYKSNKQPSKGAITILR